MRVEDIYEAREETKEAIRRLVCKARLESIKKGRPSWQTRERIVDELTRLRQLEKQLNETITYSEVIGIEM